MNFEEWAIANGHSVERIASTGEYHCRLTRRAAAAWEAATGKQQADGLATIIAALEHSKPTHDRYPQPVERHAEALAHARALAARQGDGDFRKELFTIAGGDIECSPCPSKQQVVDCVKDLRSCYDEALAAKPDDLCGRLQQKCSDWNTYWRAPDAHGVNLNIEQALELLRDALGVEVAIDLRMFEPAVDALYSKQVSEYEDGQYGDDELERIEGERFDMMQLIRRTSP